MYRWCPASGPDCNGCGSLAGRSVALVSSGELPCVHTAHPVPAGLGRRANPRIAGNMGVTQGVYVRPILVDPCAYLISSGDGNVAGDEDIDVARHSLEQQQRGEVVLDRRVSGVVQVEHRNQDIRKHVAGDEYPAFLKQQGRMTRGMRLMLDIAARGAVTRPRAEPGVPEQMIPMRMRREACHNGLARIGSAHPPRPASARGSFRLWIATASRDCRTWGWRTASTTDEAYEPRRGCPDDATIEVFGDRYSLP